MSVYLTDDEINEIVDGLKLIDKNLLLIIFFVTIISYIVCWNFF